jgi:glutathione S-transferase
MKVYGSPVSTCTRKVLATLLETGLPYELVPINFAEAEHKKEPHLSRQPFGKVPAIEDDGFSLYESRAIIRYINDKAGGSLVPSDLRQRATMEQWISVEFANFTPAAMKFVYQHVFRRAQEPAVLERATAELDQSLAVLDARLARSEYLAGPTFSLADLCYLPYFEYLMATPVQDKVKAWPNVMGWWSRCSERPAWRKVAGRA